MTLRVFLDANVLVPITMADVLLRLGDAGLIEPYWSEAVLDEVDRALAQVHTEMHRRGVSGVWLRSHPMMAPGASPSPWTRYLPRLLAEWMRTGDVVMGAQALMLSARGSPSSMVVQFPVVFTL